jgi:predicted RNase H-like HicB family nuclease
MNRQFTAVIEREGDGYISFCPEVDVASQGNTVQEASENLREAVELFFESAPQDEISRRLHDEVYITRLEVLDSRRQGVEGWKARDETRTPIIRRANLLHRLLDDEA